MHSSTLNIYPGGNTVPGAHNDVFAFWLTSLWAPDYTASIVAHLAELHIGVFLAWLIKCWKYLKF